MKILLTGAASFTGFWFARRLAESGHELICPLRGDEIGSPSIRQDRLAKLRGQVQIIPNAPFGSDRFLGLASETNYDLLCHHGAEVKNYRSPDFDVVGALKSNTLNLPRVIAAMNGVPIVLTGSVFEQDEGDGGDFVGAFSPYGLSKGLTWQYFRHFCESSGVRLGKFVIPNPFGPFEEPRFTAYLMKTWKEGKVVEVKTPDYVRDNIPVDLLAQSYCSFAEDLASNDDMDMPLLHSRPSGYVGTQESFVEIFAKEVRRRYAWECDFILCKQTNFLEPKRRVNTDPQLHKYPKWSESYFWNNYIVNYA